MADDVPSLKMAASELASPMLLVDLLVRVKACASKGEARRLLGQKGIRVNGKQPEGDNPTIGDADFRDGEVLVLQKGKRDNFLVIVG